MQAQPYTSEQKAEIEKVRAVFLEYIQTSPYIDLLWSDKFGYLLVSIDPTPKSTAALESDLDLIDSGETLCNLLFSEIYLDVINSVGKKHDSTDPDKQQRAEFERRRYHYTALLPEYEHLRGEFFG